MARARLRRFLLVPAVVATAAVVPVVTAGPAAAATTGGLYTPLSGTRVVDTRSGLGGTTGPVANGKTLKIPMLGQAGVPATGVTAVLLSVTVTAPNGAGHLIVWPDGATKPSTQNIAYLANQTATNLVPVAPGTTGNVDINVAAGLGGKVQIVVDVNGYYATTAATTAGAFAPLPARRLATSTATAGTPLLVTVAGKVGVPSTGVAAVALTFTANKPTGSGTLTAYAAGTTAPGTATATLTKSQVVSELAIVPLSAAGQMNVLFSGTGKAPLTMDVAGYIASGSAGPKGSYVPLPATRIASGAAVPANGSLLVSLDGQGGVPPQQVQAVAVDVTATSTSAGELAVYAQGGTQPATTAVSFAANQPMTGLVLVPVKPATGNAYLANRGTAATQLNLDVVGYVVGPPTCGGQTLLKPDGVTSWQCDFDDEFSGTSLDTSSWYTNPGQQDQSGSRLACTSSDNVTEGGGMLTLSMRHVDTPVSCNGLASANYTMGEVLGVNAQLNPLHAWTYGRFEISAKVPSTSTRGLHSALWMWPVSYTYGPNYAGNKIAYSGEMDIAEFDSVLNTSGGQTNAIPTMHYVCPTAAGTPPCALGANPPPGVGNNVITDYYCMVNVNAFNTYTFVWQPGRLTMSINGALCLDDTYTAGNSTSDHPYAPFDMPFYLILSQGFGVGGNSFDAANSPTWPQSTLIDYVRVWQ